MVASVLSGNRNFEGRIHPEVKMNYLASPPLCVAYALAGRMDLDLVDEPLQGDVYLRDLWPTRHEVNEAIEQAIESDMFRKSYGEVFEGDENWNGLSRCPRATATPGIPSPPTSSRPPYFEGMPAESPEGFEPIQGARVIAVLGDSVTTDHISPAGAIKKDSPAGALPDRARGGARDFNSYGSRRGNHEVMMRGTFANIRLRNQLAPGTEGGFTKKDGEETTIYDAAMEYADEDMPLCVLAGKEYGSGSSRDWAAKGPRLLGVRFVIAESYERIHRSNLVGMGVLPLQFPDGESVESLGLTGEETLRPRAARGGGAHAGGADRQRRRVRGAGADRHPERVAVLPRRRDPALRAAPPAWLSLGTHGSSTTTSASAAARPTCSGCSSSSSGRPTAGWRGASSSSRTTRARRGSPTVACSRPRWTRRWRCCCMDRAPSR